MSLSEVIVEGTLQPDGALTLDSRPNLPAGRVRVIVQQVSSEKPAETWWEFMQRARRELESQNRPTLSEQEIEAHIRSLREDDDRIAAVYREIEEERKRC